MENNKEYEWITQKIGNPEFPEDRKEDYAMNWKTNDEVEIIKNEFLVILDDFDKKELKKKEFIDNIMKFYYHSWKILKGNKWNWDYNSNVWMTSSSSNWMFSIGGLIIKNTSYSCSPDWSYGYSNVDDWYSLEKDISLDEFNNTEINKYGQWSNDIQKIINLKDSFSWNEEKWDRFSNSNNTYLAGIFTSDDNLTSNLKVTIEEIRNNPWKYLHIYSISEWYEYLIWNTFEESLFNISHKVDENIDKKINWRWKTFNIEIDSSNWYYTPSIYIVEWTSENKVSIWKDIPDGSYNIYLGDIPVTLYLKSWKDLFISISADHSWNNKQDWYYIQHKTHNVKKGYFKINWVDAFSVLNEKWVVTEEEAKNNRIKKFNKYSKIIRTIYGKEVLDVIKGKDWNILSLLAELSERKTLVDIGILKRINSVYELNNFEENLLILDTCNYKKVLKVYQKCWAWQYLNDVLKWVDFKWNFDEVMNSVKYFVNLANFVNQDNWDSFNKINFWE